ncbi:MAG: tetratricopeptide repeat protein [Ktedonobacterales bacterium]
MTNSRDQQRQITRRVFISSTSVDLRAHRERVSNTLLSLGLFPVGMEHFGAQGTGDASSVSTDQVAGSDVYLGIYAWRYGTIPAHQERSVTHQEYDEATRLSMPRYLFLADPSTEAATGPEGLFPADVRDPEHRAQLDSFRAEVGRTHVVDFFTTPEDLAARVATALSNYLLQVQREELSRKGRIPHDLPPRTPGFVGRERELATLFSALRRGQDGDAVALVGMAGAGKSTLAAEAMHAVANASEAFPGGTSWIRCDGRTGLAGLIWVEDQILTAWGATLTPDELAGATSLELELEARERALRRLTSTAGRSPAPALVLLDNVEHDLPLSRALESLAPLGMRVLLTARYQPSSPRVRLVALDVLEPASAVQLFEERYTSRGGNWDAVRDHEAAAAVVDALGWLPLAIELAAARAARTHQGMATVAMELREADRLGKLRDPLDPTHSVRYAFTRSLELLTDGQRARFALLGLPEGSDWPRPFVERLFAVASALAPDAAPAADDVETLAALSLLTLTEGGSRIRLHPLVRDLARAEWHIKPEASQKSDMRALFEAASDEVAGHTRDFAFLAREEELIIGALDGAAGAGVEPARITAQIEALEPYLDLGGRWRLGRELFTRASELSSRNGDRSGEARALNNVGVFAQRLGDPDAAERAFAGALALRNELGDQAGQAETLSNLGGLAHMTGRPEKAQATYQQALAIRHELGDRPGEAIVLNNLGLLAAERGQFDEARDALNQALALGNPAASVLNNLGGVAEAQGNLAEARSFFEQSLGAARAASDRAGEATALDNLGNVARALGELPQATSCYEQALAIRRALDDERGEATTLHNLGVLSETAGEAGQAREYFTQALTVARSAGDGVGEAAALVSLGALARASRQLEPAQGLYEQALTIYHEVGDQSGEALTLAQLGELAQAQARPDDAAHAYERALAIRRALGDRHSSGLLQGSLGLLAYSRGRPAEATERLREALELLEATGDAPAARTVRENLAALTAQQEPPPSAEPVVPAAPMPVARQPSPPPTSAAAEIETRRRRWPWSR